MQLTHHRCDIKPLCAQSAVSDQQEDLLVIRVNLVFPSGNPHFLGFSERPAWQNVQIVVLATPVAVGNASVNDACGIYRWLGRIRQAVEFEKKTIAVSQGKWQ